jgi:hypothetical protein
MVSPSSPTGSRGDHERFRVQGNANLTLRKSIDATFKNRQTPVPADEFDALSTDFVRAHRIQWNAFVKKMGEAHLADTFGKVVEDLRDFALPVLRSLASGEKLTQQRKAGTGWVAS